MAAIGADGFDVAVSGHEHGVPAEQFLVFKRRGPVRIDIRHHLGDAALLRADGPRIRIEPELAAQRGLHAGAIQNFALDLGRLDRFVAQEFDAQLAPVVLGEMPHGADHLAG